ncbi:hypothetical protein L6R49_27310 [Myxococcota bacterium]|nr:hypothetical protein [Myxococcota bacterium]
MDPLSPCPPSALRLWGKRALKGVGVGAALVVLGLLAFEAARPGPTLQPIIDPMIFNLLYRCEAGTAEEFRDIVRQEYSFPEGEHHQPVVDIELDEWLQSVLADERYRQRSGRELWALLNVCLCPQEITFVEHLKMYSYSRENGRLVRAYKITDFGAYCDGQNQVTFGATDEPLSCDCRVIHPGAITEDVLIEYRQDRDVDHLWRSLLLRSVPEEPLTPRVFRRW